MAVKHGPCMLTLKKDPDSQNQVPEETSPHLLLKHRTKNWVWSEISSLVGPEESLLATVKRWKLAWFEHVARHDSRSKTILQGTLEGGRRLGRQRNRWKDKIKEWTYLQMPELLTRASCRND